MTRGRRWALALLLAPGWVSFAVAQAATAAPVQVPAAAVAPPLATPTFPVSLQAPVAHVFQAGPLGPIAINGVFAAFGQWQDNPQAGDRAGQAALSQGFVVVQKTTGWWGFYLQAGVYDLPALGTPFLSNGDTLKDLFGPVPVGYLKFNLGKNANLEAGILPTLFGDEYTFGFQDLNIERGLLVNQENDVDRGLQFNDSWGKLSTSLSWNDGFYSNRFTWLTGSANYAFNAASSITAMIGGNLGHTAYRTAATPVQNNSRIYDFIYSYTQGGWTVSPYCQYTAVPGSAKAGVAQGASTRGAALLVAYRLQHRVWLAGRLEYIAASTRPGDLNLLYGPGSRAWSSTLTPTWQQGALFARGELGWVHVTRLSAGDGFGPSGNAPNQVRAALETGVIF